MATEVIDIQIREAGAAPAAAAVKSVGTAAEVSEVKLASFNSMVSQVTGALGILGLAFSASKIIGVSEAYNELIERLKTVSKSSKDLIDQEQKLFDLAQRTRQSLDGTISLYVGLKKATQDLHVSQSTLLQVVGTINQALIVSRKSGEDVAGAMRRFSASLAQGKVDGRGLNTILLQFPALAKAMADGFNGGVGISVGRLRELSQEGKITAKQILDSLVVAGPKVAEAFKRTQVTVSEAFTVLNNAIERQIGIMDQGAGATHLMAEAILVIAANINVILPTLLALGAGITAMGLAALVTRGYVFSLFAALAANPFTLLVGVIVTVIALVYEFGNSMKLTADGSITLLGAMVGAWRVLVQAVTVAYNFIAGYVVKAFDFLSAAVAQANQFLQQHPVIMQVVIGALTGLAIALAATALAASPLLLALAALATAFVAGYAAMLYFKGGTELVKQKFGELKDTISSTATSVAGDLTKKFGDSMRQATADTTAGGLAAKDWGDSFKKTVPDVVNTVKFGSDSMRSGINGVSDSLNNLKATAVDAGLTVRNAMGDMVTAESDWALRSGQAFNQVSGSASKMASSVTDSFETAQSAANSFKTPSSFDSGGGGGGGGGGGFSGGGFTQTGSGQKGWDAIVGMIRENGGNVGALDMATKSADAMFGNPLGPQTQDALLKVIKAQPKAVQDVLRPYYGQFGGRYPQFATGGEFTVGGGGGVDSQLIQFMATPGERVKVETPKQQRRSDTSANNSNAASQRPIVVNMTVVTPDAGSFRRSETQITTELLGKLNRAAKTLAP